MNQNDESTNTKTIVKKDEDNDKEARILKRTALLSDDLIRVIKSFIPIKVTIFLNRKTYMKNHSVIRKYVLRDQYENYIRAMIRRDNDFVFSLLIQENFERWLFFKKYVYKTTMFSNYIYFLLEYCIENDSEKCKQIVNKYIVNSGLSKNQHKKNTTKNIRWSN